MWRPTKWKVFFLHNAPDRFRINNMHKTSRQKHIHSLSILVIVITLSFLGVLLYAYFEGDFNSVESFQKYVSKFGLFGPLFLTAFQAVQVIIPVLPGFLGCAVGSVMFGPLIGFLCNYIGISTGSIIAFFLAKRFGKPLIQDLFPAGKYRRWSTWASTSKSYAVFLFLATLLPLFPDDFLCYFSGITEMNAKKFIWIIILGKPWCILAYSLGFSLIK